MARTLPPRHWHFSRRRRIPPGPASRSGPWTDLFHAVAAWHHIPLNGHLRRQRRKVGVSMAETSCKRCMSIATRRAQNSVLVDKRVHRPWYQGLSDGPSGRQRQDGPVSTTVPAILDCSLGDADPTGYSVSVDGYSGWDNATAGERNGIPSGQAPGACRSWRFSGDWLHRSYIRGCCRPWHIPGRASLSVPRLSNDQRPGQVRGWHAGTDITGRYLTWCLATHPGRWAG